MSVQKIFVCSGVYFSVALLKEGCSIMMAGHSGNSFPCATIRGFLELKFVFCEFMKCSKLSSFISPIVSAVVGFFVFNPVSLTHR